MRNVATYCAIAISSALSLTACQTGSDNSVAPRIGGKPKVTFAWKAADEFSGSMTATYSDGRAFTGSYVRVARDMQLSRLEPMWEGWSTPWRFWVYWDRPYAIAFAHYYHGRVVANLKSEDGERLRCNFVLSRAAELADGTRGACQFSDGRTFDAELAGP